MTNALQLDFLFELQFTVIHLSSKLTFNLFVLFFIADSQHVKVMFTDVSIDNDDWGKVKEELCSVNTEQQHLSVFIFVI